MEDEIQINLDDDNLDISIEEAQDEGIDIEDNSQRMYEYNYDKLENKPKINDVELTDNKTLEDLGIVNDKNYLHIQSVASNEWIINHNLNKYPSVSVIDSAENEVIGEVEYIDTNNLKLKFAGSFSGKATLN